jgi:NAD(P)-dependent dehydrogenase (short-subunit alcohol dehydrogenase family)
MSAQQKVVIVTGASQGIGAALVKAYRDRKYRVVATSRSIEQSGDQDEGRRRASAAASYGRSAPPLCSG